MTFLIPAIVLPRGDLGHSLVLRSGDFNRHGEASARSSLQLVEGFLGEYSIRIANSAGGVTFNKKSCGQLAAAQVIVSQLLGLRGAGHKGVLLCGRDDSSIQQGFAEMRNVAHVPTIVFDSDGSSRKQIANRATGS